MKYLIAALMFFIILFSSCGKKEETKIQAFNAEAYAYKMDSGWEVNATTRVKGFMQNKGNGKFTTSIAYDVDLVTPKGDTIKSMISKVEDKTLDEEPPDIGLEVQFDLDSTYAPGKYKIIFNLKDVKTNKTTVISKELELSK